MVLNHASLVFNDHRCAPVWLKDMAIGMKSLIEMQVCSLQQGLRMSNEGSAIFYGLLFGGSKVTTNPQMREEIQFLMALGSRVPLLRDVDDDVVDRISRVDRTIRCEDKTLPLKDGKPLLFCAFTDAIAVGFPSEDVWDSDELTVRFDELLPDANIGESVETIDNLTRSSHAPLIRERYMEALRQLTDRDAFWNARELAFSNVRFLPEVEQQLSNLDSTAWLRVSRAFDRMETGNLSNAKGLGAGISEIRLDFGPGYRIYFGEHRSTLMILRCGTKQGQNQDIRAARRLWQGYRGGS